MSRRKTVDPRPKADGSDHSIDRCGGVTHAAGVNESERACRTLDDAPAELIVTAGVEAHEPHLASLLILLGLIARGLHVGTTSGAGHGPAVVLLHGWPQRGTAVPIHAGADRPRAPRGNRLRAVRRQQDGPRGDLRSAASRARAHLPSVCAPELLEQGSRLDQVGRVESLREPRVDLRHQRVGLGRLALARP